MYKNKKIIAIITARGGSKRLPGKNIKKLHGKPLIAYAIQAAKNSKYIDRLVVSTDDQKIAKVSKKYGAEVPFMRPAELAADNTLTLPVLQHAVRHMEEFQKFMPELVVLIQPTSPLVLASDIDGAVEEMFKTGANSCFSVCEINQRPEWMYQIKNNKPVSFLRDKSKAETISQFLPKVYVENGAVNVFKKEMLMEKNKTMDANRAMFIMPRERSVDIDEEFDFKIAEAFLNK